MAQLIPFASLVAKPWKNGGGSTTEVAIWPPAAAIEQFDWRISVASVASDGPFSLFPGIDRTLVLLQGAGMDLMTADGSIEALRAQAPLWSFAGELPVVARLCAGPTIDFNVMTLRASYQHQVLQHQIDAPHAAQAGADGPGQLHLLRQAASTLLFVASAADNASCVVAGQVLRQFDSVLFDATDPAEIHVQSTGVLSLLQVELTALKPSE